MSATANAQGFPDADLVAHGIAAESVAELRSELEAWCSSREIAGLRLLVLHRGEVVLRGDFGRAPALSAVNPDSSAIGIYGLGALLAIEFGLLDPARPLRHYLPTLTESALGEMTVDEYLTRGTGPSVRPRRTRGEPNGTRRDSSAPTETVRSEVLLPALLESASGIAVERWLEDRVLLPCGLANTSIVAETPSDNAQPFARRTRMTTTLDDLARFTRLLEGKIAVSGVRSEHFDRLRGDRLDDFRGEVQANDPGRAPARAIGYVRERVDDNARALSLATSGAGAVHCWTDLDLELTGVVQFTTPPRSPRLLARLRKHARGILPIEVKPVEADWSHQGDESVEVSTNDTKLHSEFHYAELRLHKPIDGIVDRLVVLIPDPVHDAIATDLANHLASHGYGAAIVDFAADRPTRHARYRPRNAHVAGGRPPELPLDKRTALHHRGGDLTPVDRFDEFLERARVVRDAARSLPGELRSSRNAPVSVIGFGEESRTALLLGGVELTTELSTHAAPDAAVDAVLVIAPPAPNRLELRAEGLRRLGVPLFVATRAGLHVESVGGLGLPPRALFDLTPHVHKCLITDVCGDAFDTNESKHPLVAGMTAFEDYTSRGATERALLFGTLTAFLESALGKSESADRWLETNIVAHPRRITILR